MSTYTMAYDSQLSEGYVLTAGIPIASSSETPVAVFFNRNDDTELLAIHADGELYHVAREPLSESGWNFYGIGAGFQSVAASGYSTAWAFGSDNNVWRFSKNRWTQVPVTLPGGAAIKDLSSGLDGTAWIVDTNNQLYQYSPSDAAWKPVSNVPPLQSAPRGTNTSAWAIDIDNVPVTLIDGTWFQAFLPENLLAMSLTVGPDGAVWISAIDALQSAPYFYRRIGDQDWQAMPMPPDGTVQQLCATGANEVWAVVCKSSFGQCSDSPWIEHYVNGQWQIDRSAPPLTIAPDFAAIAGGSDGAVFCIDTINRIWRRQNQTQSWQRCIMPTGMHGATAGGGVTEVVTLEDFDLHWHALYVRNGQVNYLAFDGTSWGSPLSIDDGSLVGLTLDPQSHNVVGYGVTSGGKFLVITFSRDGNFTRNEYDAGSDLSGTRTQLTILNDKNWVTTAVINGYLAQSRGTAASPLTPDPNNFSAGFTAVSDSQHPTNPPPRGMRSVIRLPWTQSDGQNPYTAVVDEAGNIYMVFNLAWGISFELSISQGSFVQLTGSDLAKFGRAPRVSGVQDDDENIRLYATDANGKLWVLRQTGITGNDDNPFTWTQWHPLGNEYSWLANGPRTRTTTELYSIDTDNTLTQLLQNATTKAWSERQIKRPAGVQEENDYVSQYVTEITVTKDGGLPASNYNVTITADEEGTIQCASQSYDLVAGQPLTLTTDMMGRLRITSVATGVHAARLGVQGDGLANPQSIYPPQAMHDYLAGSGTLPGKPAFTTDGSALVSAQSQTGSAFAKPVTMSQGLDGDTAKTVAGTSIDIFAMAPTASRARSALSVRGRGAGSVAGSTAGGAAGSAGDFWNEIVHWAEDLDHAIRTGIVKIKDVTRDIEKKVVSLTLSIEGIADKVIDFTIHTLQDAVSALHNIFRWIVDKIEDLIDWLKSLFEWHDIWNTKKVIAHVTNESFQALEYLLQDKAKVLVDGFFADMRATLAQNFTTASGRLQGKSFNDLLSSAPRDRASRARSALAAARLTPDDFSKPDARQNWMMNQFLSNMTDDSGMDDVVLPMIEGDVQCLLEDLDAEDIKASFEGAYDCLAALIKKFVDDPEGFKNSGFSDFIDAVAEVMDFVITVAQKIVKALIDLVALIVENIDTVLTHALDIPLVSTFYQALSEYENDEEDLTLLNACALALGFQFTILYKTVSGGSKPPFTDDQVAAILQEKFPSATMLRGAAPGDDNLEWKILFGFWSGIVALSDTSADYVAAALVNVDGKTAGVLQSATKFVGFINTIALSCAQIMGRHLLPNYDSWDWSAMSDEEKWAKGAWVAAWGAPIVNAIWLLVPLFATIPRAELAGQIALTTVGAVNTGVGITAAVQTSTEDDEIAGIAIAVLVNSASTLTPLLMDFVVDLTEGGSPGFKGWADAFTDIAGGILVATTSPSLEAAGGPTLAGTATA